MTKAAEAIPMFDAAVKQTEETTKQTEATLEAEKKAATETEKPLRAVAFSPDAATGATAGDDQMVHTWDVETGAAVDRFVGQGANPTQLAYLADGSLISAAANKNVSIWLTAIECKLERTIGAADKGELLVDRVTALDFSSDGKVLATGGGEPSRSGEIKFWNVESGSPISALKDPHSDTVFGLEFSPDGKQIAENRPAHAEDIDPAGPNEVEAQFTGRSRAWIADFVWKWAPDGNARDRSVKLQAEVFRRSEDGTLACSSDIASSPCVGATGALALGSYQTRQSGGYVQGVWQFAPHWRVGARYDWLSPGTKHYDDAIVFAALDPGASLFSTYRPKRSSLMSTGVRRSIRGCACSTPATRRWPSRSSLATAPRRRITSQEVAKAQKH